MTLTLLCIVYLYSLCGCLCVGVLTRSPDHVLYGIGDGKHTNTAILTLIQYIFAWFSKPHLGPQIVLYSHDEHWGGNIYMVRFKGNCSTVVSELENSNRRGI